jgi:hypothetical protein
MADIKNFSLVGVGTKLQFGKGGAKVFQASDAFTFRTANEQSYANVSVAAPTDDNHAATRKYVDDRVQGLDVKQSVKVATTAAITLSGGQLIDDVMVSAGDRVLVKDQADATQNGIYTVAVSAWVRSSDANGTNLTASAFTFVEQGTTNHDTGWTLSTDDAIVVGTTPLNFTQFSSAGLIVAGDGLVRNGQEIKVVGTNGRILVNADSIDIDSTYLGQASITTLGTITTGTWNGATIDVAHGGTGATTFTPKALIIGNGTGPLGTLAVGAAGTILKSDGTNLSFGTNGIDDLSDVTITSPVTGQALKYNGTAWINAKLSASDVTYNAGTVSDELIALASDIANLSSTRIVDNKTTPTSMVATDESVGVVTIDAKGVSDLATRVATFASGPNADTSGVFSNLTAGEFTFSIDSLEDNVNLRLNAKGPLGEVIIGETGSTSEIVADRDANLIVAGGDSDTVGGDLVLRGGNGTLGSGDVIIQTGAGNTHTNFIMTTGSTSQGKLISGTTSFTYSTGGSEVDIDLILAPKGAGKISANSTTIVNVANGVAPTDAVNVSQLASVVGDAGVANKVGSLQTREITLSTATMNIGEVIKGLVRRVMVKVTTAYSAGAQLTVGRVGAVDELVDANMIDETSVGLYDMNVSTNYATDTQLLVTVTGGPAAGAAVLVIEYIQA